MLWFGPELWGSGEPLRASSRANNPNPGSAAFADHPGLEVVKRFHERTIVPLEAARAAWRPAWRPRVQWRRDAVRRARCSPSPASAVAWIGLVAFMTERGYAGNQRYLIVTTAAICVLGGIGAGPAASGPAGRRRAAGCRTAGRTRGRRGCAVVVGLVALAPCHRATRPTTCDETLDVLRYEASLWDNLPDAIEKAGGRDRLLACGNVYSGPFQTQMVAYELGIHGIDVGALGGTPPPGVVFRTQHRARAGRWWPS